MNPVKLVAVIDDEPDVLLTISVILRRHGYDVITGRNANEASTIVEQHPDIILLDMNMPGKQGTDLCRELKSAETTKDIRIVIISGNPQLEKAYRQCGADSFLQKPFDKNELLQIVS
jgi:CheY-like chemotaxis protein